MNLLPIVVLILILTTAVYLILERYTNVFENKEEETKQEDRRKSGSKAGQEKEPKNPSPSVKTPEGSTKPKTRRSSGKRANTGAKSATPVEKKSRKNTSSSKRSTPRKNPKTK